MDDDWFIKQALNELSSAQHRLQELLNEKDNPVPSDRRIHIYRILANIEETKKNIESL